MKTATCDFQTGTCDKGEYNGPFYAVNGDTGQARYTGLLENRRLEKSAGTGETAIVPVARTDNGDIPQNISHLKFRLIISKTMVYTKGEPDILKNQISARKRSTKYDLQI